jgi:hypothetical protein
MHFWELFQWWNLVFTLPFGIGLLPLLLQAAGIAHSGHNVLAGSHHLPSHEVPHLGSSGHSFHAQGHVTSAPHAPAYSGATPESHAASPGSPFRLSGFLGFGKVPIMLLFSIFCLLWGTTGVLANLVFSHVLRIPALYVWPSLFCAFVTAYVATGKLSQRISRVFPEVESYGTDEELLVGHSARTAYELGPKPGSAFLLDEQQNRVQVRCRTHDGSTIPRGAEVLLLEYDAQSRIFTVVQLQREPQSSSSPSEVKQPALQQQKSKLP